MSTPLSADMLAATICRELKYGTEENVKVGSKSYSKAQLAILASDSYLDHLAELPSIPMGADWRTTEKAQRKHMREAKRLIKADMAATLGIDPSTLIGIVSLILGFFTGGTGSIIIGIIAAVIQWYIASRTSGRLSNSTLKLAAELGS